MLELIETLEMQCGAFYKSHLFSYLFRLSLMQQMPSAQPKCNKKYRIANKLKTGSPLFPRLCACVECVFFFPLAGPIRDLQHKARRQMQGRSCVASQRWSSLCRAWWGFPRSGRLGEWRGGVSGAAGADHSCQNKN